MPFNFLQSGADERRQREEREAAAAQTADRGLPSQGSLFLPGRAAKRLAEQRNNENKVSNEGSILGGVPIVGKGQILGGLEPGDFTKAVTSNIPQQPQQAKTEVKITPMPMQKQESRPNPLFAYPDYTYGLSLHVIPVEKYNAMVKTPGYQYKNDDDTVLIASAGRRNGVDFKRNARFYEDFYIDNFKMTTVVGLNSRSRNSNAIEISFNITEPYGFTLINRLIKMANDIKTYSWMQIPFLIQIDFFGNTETGGMMHPIPNQTKYIPIRLIGIKSKVTGRGAEYAVQAVPFNHQAYNETNGTTPAFMEVKATTVADFFSAAGEAGDIEKITTVKNITKERLESAIKSEKEVDESSGYGGALRAAERVKQARAVAAEVPNTSYVVGSYAAAINSYHRQLVENNYTTKNDSYEFVFDDEIKNSKIVVPARTAATRTKMADPKTAEGVAAIRAQAGLPAKLDLTQETFTINAGTSIIEVINQVMRASEYVRSQFRDPAVEPPTSGPDAAIENKVINWYKIIPVVEIMDFDLKREVYSKKITYYVKTYQYYNSKFKDAPSAIPSSFAKNYQYIYTGKNDSILNFDIDFDIMFYTAMTANRSKVQATAIQEKPIEDQVDDSKKKQIQVRPQDRVTHMVSGQADMVTPASPDSKAVLVNDFSKSMMSSSRGDMINVRLKIIGDPEFIKQDDLFYNPANNPNQRNTNFIDPKSNSIMYDAGEIFVLLEFFTPTDYNVETGLMDFDSIEQSVFSGVYKIITVENNFERGQFTQSIDLIRMFNQEKYDAVKSGAGSKSSSDTAANRLPDQPTISSTKLQEGDFVGPPQPDPEIGMQLPAATETPAQARKKRAFSPSSIAAQQASLRAEISNLPTTQELGF